MADSPSRSGSTTEKQPGPPVRGQPLAGTALGLQACQPEPTNVCGELTVEMTDDWGDGWDIGALKVYINDAFAYELTCPTAKGRLRFAACAGRG